MLNDAALLEVLLSEDNIMDMVRHTLHFKKVLLRLHVVFIVQAKSQK